MKKLLSVAVCLAVAIGALADQPFRNHRYDSFKATPTEPGQIVFAGNSITNMHSWFEAFGSHQEVIGRGNSGGFAYELLDNLENFIDSKPAKFFLMIGTNDLASGQSVDVTARRIQTIVRRVRLESPETEVYVQSILPRSHKPKPDYEECNTVMRDWIASLNDPKVTFVNLSEVCAGVNGSSWWAYDGLHPRAVGYGAWTNEIEDLVGYPSVYPDNITDQSNSCGLSGVSASRVEQFAFFPTMEGDVFFFGDEQVHGGEWHELLRSPKIKDRGLLWGWGGITLDKAKNVVANSLSLHETKPAKIFLFYGIGGTNETNYRALVDAAKNGAPEAKVYIVSLSPSSDSNTNSARVTFNQKLQEIATEKGATYVDVYTPLAENVAQNIMHTNYISGRGYVVMANALAPYLTEEGVNPVSLAEYDALYERRTARTIIGNALTSAMMMNYGSELGQIADSRREAIEALFPTLINAVNDPNLTVTQAEETVAEINQLIEASYAELNMPEASTEGNDVWYTLTSARGTVSTLTVSGGKLVGGTMPEGHSDGTNIWKFVTKTENTFDIINGNGQYLSPNAAHNTQLSVTASAPSEGWQISYSTVVPGAYVIYTSNAQVNQTELNNAVYNWFGTSTPNRDDQGCAYYISLFGGNLGEPDPVEIPEAVLTLTNTNFNGTFPYCLTAEEAAKVFALDSYTIAIDVTMNGDVAGRGAFVCAADPSCDVLTVGTPTDTPYFALGHNGNKMSHLASSRSGDMFTASNIALPANTNMKIVFTANKTADATGTLCFYGNGVLDVERVYPLIGYELPVFSEMKANHPNANVYIGGGMAGNAPYEICDGTIASVQFFDCALTAEQIASINYTDLETSAITEVERPENTSTDVFDLQGRKVINPGAGIYIVGGKKVFLR